MEIALSIFIICIAIIDMITGYYVCSKEKNKTTVILGFVTFVLGCFAIIAGILGLIYSGVI